MSLVILLRIKNGEDGALDSHRRVERIVILLQNSIYSLESESGNLTEFKWILLENLHALCTEVLINFRSSRRRDLEGRKQNHNVPQASAFQIRRFDLIQFRRCNAADFQ